MTFATSVENMFDIVFTGERWKKHKLTKTYKNNGLTKALAQLPLSAIIVFTALPHPGLFDK